MYLLTTIIQFSYLPNPVSGNQKSDIVFQWIWIPFLDSSCKYLPFSVWRISLSIMPSTEIQPHCCKWQDFLPFNGWIVFWCVCVYTTFSKSIYPSMTLSCKNHWTVHFKWVNWWYVNYISINLWKRRKEGRKEEWEGRRDGGRNTEKEM